MADGETAPKKKSDLGVRTLSAIVLLVVVGTALWFGGLLWQMFVALIAAGVFWEFSQLVFRITQSVVTRTVSLLLGIAYIGSAAGFLGWIREAFGAFDWGPLEATIGLIGLVICVDVGAYFAGRSIGGPKIAPSISPSKTWAGLLGGAVAATLFFFFYEIWAYGWWAEAYMHECQFVPYGQGDCAPSFERWMRITDFSETITIAILMGVGAAVLAQAGDFFESWLKRKVGVKDSGNLIPGHGGLFDRVDGLLAVCFVLGLLVAWDTFQ